MVDSQCVEVKFSNLFLNFRHLIQFKNLILFMILNLTNTHVQIAPFLKRMFCNVQSEKALFYRRKKKKKACKKGTIESN